MAKRSLGEDRVAGVGPVPGLRARVAVGSGFLMDATDPERPADPGSPEPSLPEPGSFAPSDDDTDSSDLDALGLESREEPAPGPTTAPDPVSAGAAPDAPEARAIESAPERVPEIAEDASVVAPAVVLVVVAHDPGPWFTEALTGIATQDYPNLTVLVVDNGSFSDPSELVAGILPGAFIVRFPETLSFAQAVNQGARSVEGATFLLVCHDDVVLGAGAVRLMVEEAFRSNAAVVGPKLVNFARPEVLLQVGLSIDKFAVPWSGIEPGEVDQEQHDAVRDVFFVPAAAMLVRADLFAEIGGMDPKLHHRVADADLCWRTRLMGGRVIVAPDAFARHLGATSIRTTAKRSDNAHRYRSRLRVLLKVQSPLSLLAVIPQYLLLSILAVLRLVVIGRFGEAGARLGAWTWNTRNIRGTLKLRRIVQRQRHVPDRELRSLQVRSTTRLRSLLTTRFADESRVRAFDNLRRGVATSATSGMREPVVAVFLLLLALVGLGARHLISGTVPAVGSLTPWPDAGSLFDTFTSPWRFSGLGASVPAAPAFGLMGLLTFVVGDHPALARTLLVVGTIPIGALGAFRLSRPLSPGPWPAITAAVTYAALPVSRNAIANGRLGAIVLFAAAPFLVERVIRAGGVVPFVGSEFADGRRPEIRRMVLTLGLLVAVSGALCPPVLVLVPAIAAVLVVASLVTGGVVGAMRGLLVAIAGSALGALLLLPWSLSLVDPDPDGGLLGVIFHPRLDAQAVMSFDSGPASGGRLVFAVFAVGLLPLALGSGWRVAWAGRAWLLALAGWAGAWIPGQDWFVVAWPAPEVPLVIAAVGVALAVGTGMAVFVDEIQRRSFSWRQLLAALMVGATFVGSLPFVASLAGGRFDLPTRDWDRALAWMRSDVETDGHFRVLWAGRPEDLPGDPQLTYGELAYTFTRDGVLDARDLFPASAAKSSQSLEDALVLVTADRTTRLGHLLAPMAVRYIVIPDGPHPQVEGARDGELPLAAALGRQTDLTALSVTGARVWRNEAAAPIRGSLVREELPALVASGLLDATGLDLQRVVAALPAGDRLEVSGPVNPSAVLLSERYDDRWRATVGGRSVAPERVLGLINGFDVPEGGMVTVAYDVPSTQRWLVTAQIVLWVLIAWLVRRRVGVASRLATARRLAADRAGLTDPAAVERQSRRALRRQQAAALAAEDREAAEVWADMPLTRRERRAVGRAARVGDEPGTGSPGAAISPGGPDDVDRPGFPSVPVGRGGSDDPFDPRDLDEVP